MGLLLSASIDDLHVNLGASTPPKDWGSPFVFTSAKSLRIEHFVERERIAVQGLGATECLPTSMPSA
jgi:hypothetical protein